MSKQASSSSTESVLSIQVPKKLGGKKFVLADAEEYAKTKRRLAEIEAQARASQDTDTHCR